MILPFDNAGDWILFNIEPNVVPLLETDLNVVDGVGSVELKVLLAEIEQAFGGLT